MKTCVLIGGGNNTDSRLPYENEVIDKEIVKLVNKKEPNFLFIGLASNNSDSNYDQIKKYYQQLNCHTEYLKKKNIINNPQIVIDKINRADIIYIGGGDTLKLLEIIKEYQLDSMLKKAYENGTILVGKSAGAILLSNKGFSDSYILRGEKDTYEFIDGLNLIDIIICPHYHQEEQKTTELKQAIKDNKIEVIGLENNTAIICQDNTIQVIKESNTNKVWKCKYNKEYEEIELK